MSNPFRMVPEPLQVQVGGDHYKNLPVQPIEYCMANGLNACETAIVKYITRWPAKGGVTDLLKIKHYVDLLIELDPRAKATKHVALAPEAVQANMVEARIETTLSWEDDDDDAPPVG